MKLLPAASLLFSVASAFALPSSPLTTTYDVVSLETITDTAYVVDTGGILNIGTDSGGNGTLNLNYSANQLMLSGAGTINVGSNSSYGYFNITGTNSAFASETYKNIVSFTGNINVSALGTLNFDGNIPSSWGGILSIKNLNLRGVLTATSTKASNSYLQFYNLNVYDGASINSSQNLRTAWGGTWNLYSSNIFAKIRLGDTNGSNSTINLKGENVLSNVSSLAYDTQNVKITMNVDNYANVINEVDFLTGCELNITLSAERSAGNKFLIEKFYTKNGSTKQTAAMNLKNFENDAFWFGYSTNISISEDNKLYIKNVDSYIELIAYAGTTEDTLLNGKWSLDLNDDGYYVLNNSAIPEPADLAAILALLAIGLAYGRVKLA